MEPALTVFLMRQLAGEQLSRLCSSQGYMVVVVVVVMVVVMLVVVRTQLYTNPSCH